MMTQIKGIDWADYGIAIPAFLTIILMPFTYTISVGIGAGLVSHVVIRLVQGRRKAVPPLLILDQVVLMVYFLLFSFIYISFHVFFCVNTATSELSTFLVGGGVRGV